MSSPRPYIHLAGDLSGWPKGYVPTPATGRMLDQFSSELVNGDEGGEWEPENPIVVGPHGTPTITLSTAGSVLSGDVETVKGNRLDASIDATPGLVLTGGAVPLLETTITREVVIPFTAWTEAYIVGTIPLRMSSADGGISSAYVIDTTTFGLKATPALEFYTYTDLVVVSVPLPWRAQHRGATLDQLDVRVLIAGFFRVVPAVPMKIRVVRVTGNTQVALHTNAGGYDADGWLADTAATLATFTGNGEPRTLSYIPDQNNTAINPATDYFMLQMKGCGTKFSGSSWLSASALLSGIVDMRQE